MLAGDWLAWGTEVAGHYQSITVVPLDDLTRSAVFAFDQPVAGLALQPGPAGVLAVTFSQPGGAATLTVAPASGRVAPADAGLSYTPAGRGEQAWLPNLVSRVRELPGVGPEKIAFLENVFFTVVDWATRLRHESIPVASEPAAVADQPATPVAAAVAAPASASVVTAVPVEAPTTQAAGPSIQAPAAPTPASEPALTFTPTRPPTATAAPGVRLADGILRRASVRPDPQRPYVDVEIIEMDPGLLQVKMIPGTIEPKPTTGLVGSGMIPQADWGELVAGFNGGFAAMHGKFGMVVDRKVYLPPRDGIATLAVYEDGSLRMGTWGKDLAQTPDMVSYRQNCPPLIENGAITAETGKLTLWGLSVANEVYLYRSGLGLTADGRLIYAAGKSLSAYTLARALQVAGAVYAMQLDVDEYHVAFITYEVKLAGSGQPPLVEGKKLRNDMRGFDGLFLRPFQLDFFYLVRRPQRLAQPVRGDSGCESSGHLDPLRIPCSRLARAPGLRLQPGGQLGTVRDAAGPARNPDACHRPRVR